MGCKACARDLWHENCRTNAATHRAVWDIPGTPFPAHADFATENDAHLYAIRKSRELGAEVAVIPIPGPQTAPRATQGAERVSADVPNKRGAEGGEK